MSIDLFIDLPTVFFFCCFLHECYFAPYSQFDFSWQLLTHFVLLLLWVWAKQKFDSFLLVEIIFYNLFSQSIPSHQVRPSESICILKIQTFRYSIIIDKFYSKYTHIKLFLEEWSLSCCTSPEFYNSKISTQNSL